MQWCRGWTVGLYKAHGVATIAHCGDGVRIWSEAKQKPGNSSPRSPSPAEMPPFLKDQESKGLPDVEQEDTQVQWQPNDHRWCCLRAQAQVSMQQLLAQSRCWPGAALLNAGPGIWKGPDEPLGRFLLPCPVPLSSLSTLPFPPSPLFLLSCVFLSLFLYLFSALSTFPGREQLGCCSHRGLLFDYFADFPLR